MNRSRASSGVVVVESAIVLTVCALMMFGFLEMTLVLMRANSLAEAAQHTARRLVVSGELCHPSTSLGPGSMLCTAAADNPAAIACRRALFMLAPNEVDIEITWPENDNRPGDPVTVVVSYQNNVSCFLVASFFNRKLVATVNARIEH